MQENTHVVIREIKTGKLKEFNEARTEIIMLRSGCRGEAVWCMSLNGTEQR